MHCTCARPKECMRNCLWAADFTWESKRDN
jgi:hypothetical protein